MSCSGKSDIPLPTSATVFRNIVSPEIPHFLNLRDILSTFHRAKSGTLGILTGITDILKKITFLPQ